MTHTSRNFIERLKLFTDEMFPVFIYLPYIMALHICMNVASQAISSGTIVFDIYGVVGMASAFFFMLLMRTFDDLKDYELDRDIFPESVIVKQLVKKDHSCLIRRLLVVS